MTEQTQNGSVADAVPQNWVDLYAPEKWRPYLRLSRADRPIGTWLLLLPCWVGLGMAMIAYQSKPVDLWIFVACSIGAFLMRGAGCTWNDITDRHFDAKVERTRSRPIPSGQVSVKQAVLWMVIQTLLAFLILLTFNKTTVLIGVASLIPVAIYPFAKRFTYWPQIFLGIAFNWGVLLAYSAHTGTINSNVILVYIGCLIWTLFYDTIYAYQDIEDDALIGVKSTARRFGDSPEIWLLVFAFSSVAIILLGLIFNGAFSVSLVKSIIIALGCGLFLLHMLWQLKTLDIKDQNRLLYLFRSNRNAGLILALSLIIDGLF